MMSQRCAVSLLATLPACLPCLCYPLSFFLFPVRYPVAVLPVLWPLFQCIEARNHPGQAKERKPFLVRLHKISLKRSMMCMTSRRLADSPDVRLTSWCSLSTRAPHRLNVPLSYLSFPRYSNNKVFRQLGH